MEDNSSMLSQFAAQAIDSTRTIIMSIIKVPARERIVVRKK